MSYPVAAATSTSVPDAFQIHRLPQPLRCAHCGGVAFYDPLDRCWTCLLCCRLVAVPAHTRLRSLPKESRTFDLIDR
jgi:hypothetical protein